MEPLLQVEDLETFYGRSQVLFGVGFSGGEGEVVGLMGRNGMGKTTTLRSIMGLTRPSRGTVRIANVPMQRQPAFRIARAGVAIVPEGRQVFRNLTVREHLLMAESRRATSTPRWTVQRIHELFPRLQEREGHLGTQLSGGEQQMLAIARALMTCPRLVLLDEATEGLAPLVRQEIWSALRALKRSGMAIVVVDKNLQELASVADRLVVLEKGRVAWTGDTERLRSDPALQQRYLGI
ncbi:MAG TPA: ABC transporter ATP-binding protein [Ramlibacter sp.]|uniref:ABC transporter ATP-binding protein n=1 Tax=Ramlibacter sp. TaxID=1917967 RepID=UPI002B9118C6|nr:ABC transporter ATP-binding protein [Ramlibacter sp.]HVZ46566.1 ABC transporter ATP-binding protein [Ramlibacter sp.]